MNKSELRKEAIKYLSIKSQGKRSEFVKKYGMCMYFSLLACGYIQELVREDTEDTEYKATPKVEEKLRFYRIASRY